MKLTIIYVIIPQIRIVNDEYIHHVRIYEEIHATTLHQCTEFKLQ